MAIDLGQALVEEGFVVHGENKSVGLTQPALEAVWHAKNLVRINKTMLTKLSWQYPLSCNN